MNPTTAQRLIAFQQELTEAGMAPDLVDALVKDASSTLVMNQGLVVRPGSEAIKDTASLADAHANPDLVGTESGR